MQIERRVLGNATSLGLSALIGQVANFGFVILVARGFGRDVFAQYALSMAIGALICTVVSFGSISLLVRSSAQDRSRGLEMLGVILPVQWMLGIGVFAITIASGVLAKMPLDNLCILSSIVAHHIISRITAVLVAQLQGMERMDIVAVLRISRSLVTLSAALIIALTTENPILAVASMPVTSFLVLLSASAIVRRIAGPLNLRWDQTAAWHIAIQAFPFFITAMLAAAGNRIGILILSAFHGNDGVATYASGERIITAAVVLYSMLTAATLPAVSRLAPIDPERHSEVVNRLVRIVMLFVLPAATLLFLFSGDIIALLFGQEFISSVPILKIVSGVLVARSLISVQAMLAVSVGRQREVLVGRVVEVTLLVLVGLPLIRAIGPLGLAYTVLVAEVGQAAVLYVLLHRAGVMFSLPRLAGATVAGCAITLALGALLPALPVIPRVLLIVGCMFIALWGLGAIRRHDIMYFLAIIKTDRSNHSGST
jgi:O-antigen/teichoic acid export membrane protein